MDKATRIVEAFLCEENQALIAAKVPAPELAVIGNLLKHRELGKTDGELQAAYKDLLKSNPPRLDGDGPQPWQRMLSAFIETAAFSPPNRLMVVRSAVTRADELSTEIANTAKALAKLIRTRRLLCSQHNLSTPADSHPVDVLLEASTFADRSSEMHGQHIGDRYRTYIAPEIEALAERFDLRYWPTSADFVEAIANLQTVDTEALSSTVAAAMAVRQGRTVRDFWRALDARMQDLQDHYDVCISLKDQTIVALTNAALDLANPTSVANYKQRNPSITTAPEISIEL